jgi:hypothetical protein
MTRRDAIGRGLVAALAAAAALCLVPTVRAQHRPVRTKLVVPEPTTAGRWYGTWVYANRDTHVALWLRGPDDAPEIKLRYFSVATAEGFETDWDGTSEYHFRGRRGTVALTIEARDANAIEGAWRWQYGDVNQVREERAGLSVFRMGSGRQLVLHFRDFEREYRGERDLRVATEQAWTFTKVSRRHALWEELPF